MNFIHFLRSLQTNSALGHWLCKYAFRLSIVVFFSKCPTYIQDIVGAATSLKLLEPYPRVRLWFVWECCLVLPAIFSVEIDDRIESFGNGKQIKLQMEFLGDCTLSHDLS